MIGESRRDETSVFGLSFIDLVSGGFGAAFFLFLLFVTLPITVQSSRGGGAEYIDIRLKWSGNVRLEPIVGFTPKDGTLERYLRLSASGIKVNEQTGMVRHAKTPFWEELVVFGYAGRGTARMRDLPYDPAVAVTDETVTLMRLTRPCPGTYRVFVNPMGFYARGFSLADDPGNIDTVFDLDLFVADEGPLPRRGPSKGSVVVGEREGDFRPPRLFGAKSSKPVEVRGVTNDEDSEGHAFKFSSNAAEEAIHCLEP